MDPVSKLAQRLNATRRGNSWVAKCLFAGRHSHGDRTPSMSVFAAKDGSPMLKCHANCCESAELMKEARAKGLLPGPAASNGNGAPPRIVAKYGYKNRTGKLLFQVVRFEPKGFRQRRPDGNGGWSWSVPAELRTLYRLPELRAANPKTPVFVAEGEKDVNALRGVGLVATCNPGGAGKWEPKYTRLLRGRRVVVFGDNDGPGRAHAEKVAAALHEAGNRVRVIFAPAPHKDAADWIAAGATAPAIRTVVKAAPLWKPPAVARRLVLDPGDPLPSARAFIADQFTAEGRACLVHQSGDFRAWSGACYPMIEEDDIRARLYPFLEKAVIETKQGDIPFQPNAHKVNYVLDALCAETNLPTDVRMPYWLNKRAGPPGLEILPCKNGLLHLPAGTLLPHSPDFYCHNALDYDFDPDPPRPKLWYRFLRQLWPDDKQARRTLRDIFGYLLVPDTRQEKIFLLVGPKRSGKGTIGRVLTALLGQSNVCNPTLSSLNQNFGLQALIGKNLAIVGDARLGSHADQAVIAERLLSISGEDGITIDRKHKDHWTGQLPTRFLILTNELPRLADASGALASRFVVLTLTNSFLGQEDQGLTDKLLTELPGILHWAIRGWARLKQRGHFVQPKSSREAVRELEELGSPITAFLKECCRLEPAASTKCDDLYAAWKAWCGKQGRDYPGTAQTFGRDLRAAAPGLKIPRRGPRNARFRVYQGIEVRPEHQGTLPL
jgi:putative DNA primase/helicase